MSAARQYGRHAGEYFLPVNFENHCRACHAMNFDPRDLTRRVPHGLQLDETRDFLRGALRGEKKEPFAVLPPDRPLPGQPPEQLRDDNLARQVEGLVQNATTSKQGCGLCHALTGHSTRLEVVEFDAGAIVGRGEAMGRQAFRVVATGVKKVWLERGSFNHTAHRATACVECHRGVDQSRSAGDVLIPNRDNCLHCHGPAGQTSGVLRGGVRSDCVDCHRYHNSGNPLHGLGAEQLDALKKRTVTDFLQSR